MSKADYVEMKIKEKGLSGKAATARRESMDNRRGFNAFREMRQAKQGKSKAGTGKDDADSKPEIFLDFMGSKIRVYEDDGGNVKDAEVPRVRGATLRFAGCDGAASFDDIKKPLKEHFGRSPFVKYASGDDAGLVGFDRALSEEDIAFVRENVKTINGKPVSWTVAGGQFRTSMWSAT